MANSNHSNHKINVPCAFAETLVSVLYGEADAKTGQEFSLHLQSCSSCREEFAAFGSLRSGLADWKETEFLPLSVPQISWHAPLNEIQRQPPKISLLERLREFFAPSVGLWQSAAALGALAVFATLLFIFGSALFTGEQTDERADGDRPTIRNQNSSNENSGAAAPTLTPDSLTIEQLANANKSESRRRMPAADNRTSTGNQKPKAEKTKSAPVDRPDRKTPQNKPKSNPSPKQNVDLDDVLADEEDDSLRLTDMLEEITPGGE